MSCRKPRLSSIANYFLKAKSIKCLRSGLTIDVSHNRTYSYDKASNSYTTVGGAVVFWKDGEYAEIISNVKKCNCDSCDCDKTKIIKRKKNGI